MRKTIFLLLAACWLLISCDSGQKTESKAAPVPENRDTVSGFPVTDYLNGQIALIEKMPVTPLRISTAGDKTDSLWITREDIREYAAPFLHPVIDSSMLANWYTGQSFMDQDTEAFTLTYDANSQLPDSIDLRQVIVYIAPQSQKVQRIYLKKISHDGTTQQLTWLAGKWFSIRTLMPPDGKEAQVKEEKTIWDVHEG